MRPYAVLLTTAVALACSEPMTHTTPPPGGSLLVSGRVLLPDGQPAWGFRGVASARLLSKPQGVGGFYFQPEPDGTYSGTLGPFDDLRAVDVVLAVHPLNGGSCHGVDGSTVDLGPVLLDGTAQPLVRDIVLPENGRHPGRLVPGTVCGAADSRDAWLTMTLQIDEVADSVRGYWLLDHPSAIAATGPFVGWLSDGQVTLRLTDDGATTWCDGGLMRIPVGAGDTLGIGEFDATGECPGLPMRFQFVEDQYWGPLPWH